jgi:V/A-type H+-transporting ATPase subunit I
VIAFIAAWIDRKWGAFHELLNVVQVFADVMSYLRLYALALGGVVMARTFNDRLGIDMNLFAGALVILIGHTINITLAIMGGVIHGLRLNFLEWYHYSFEGGGRLFNPLKIQR